MKLKNCKANEEIQNQNSETLNPNCTGGDNPSIPLINTRLQRGVSAQRKTETFSTVSQPSEKPLKRFLIFQSPSITPLKQGVNGIPTGERFPSIFHPPSSLPENLLRLCILQLVLPTLTILSACACGPFFPNDLLSHGDDAVLAAPLASFMREVDRLSLPVSRFSHVEATNGYAEQSFDAEMADLAAALKRAKISPKESALIVEGHRVNRKKLGDYLEAQALWESRDWMDGNGDGSNNRGPCPTAPSLTEVPGLPGEFQDYLAGAAAAGDPALGDEVAREAWERLLDRPAAERKFKSIWAAYRLGKSWEGTDEDKAVEYFQRTRDLTKRGFVDSLGLATASLGREARVELHRHHCQRAIELYLEQHTAGDWSAFPSLRIALSQAISDGAELPALAASPTTRGLVTAYLISHPGGAASRTEEPAVLKPVQRWLQAVETAGVTGVDSAERLALAAYQAGEFDLAQRWVTRAKKTPVAQWIQAKLLLRAGKVPQAAALLAQVAKRLPVVASHELTNTTEFANSLHLPIERYEWELGMARGRVLGELGVLQLSRREFTQALDALLRGGFWRDAAYIAERVLTTDELKAYVDRAWPLVSTDHEAEEVEHFEHSALDPAEQRTELRYLLARRLTRELRGSEARSYLPEPWQSRHDELMQALDAGWKEGEPAEQRARALFTAAVIARTNGLELLGTELQPDWHVHDGNFEYGLTWELRATNQFASKICAASSEEIQRAMRHGTDPQERFHYRYQAALLAWEAAKLLPDNSDETARILCTAGSWLKQRDPETADMFYKALVRRCRKTAIGDQAERMRWFPVLDEAGNPQPWNPRRKTVTPLAPEEITTEIEEAGAASRPGKIYIIQSGDSLAAIAHAFSTLEMPLTVSEIIEANEELNVTRLKVGQKIFIPEAKAGMESPPERPSP